MDIEVKHSEGCYAKASVQLLSENGVTVAYEHDWKPVETVTLGDCRVLLPGKSAGSEIKVGDVVDAYFKKGGQPVQLWQKVKLIDIKGDFAVVEDVGTPGFTSIVGLADCRPLGMTQQLDVSKLYHHEIPVSADLKEYFSGPNAFDDMHAMVKDIIVAFDKEKSVISIWSFSLSSIRSARLLENIYIANTKQKVALLQRKQEKEKVLKPVTKSEDPSLCTLTFDVDKDLMGLAIGTRGTNIMESRKVDGVTFVTYDDTNKEETGVCTFTVQAKSRDAAEKARGILEYLTDSVQVPQSVVGKVVGQGGKMIQEIAKLSGAVRARVVDPRGESTDVSVLFTGTRNTLDAAKLIVQFYVRQLQEMDVLRDEIKELERKIGPSSQNFGSSGVQQNIGGNRNDNQRRTVGGQNNSGGYNQNRRYQQRNDGGQQNAQRGPPNHQLADFIVRDSKRIGKPNKK